MPGPLKALGRLFLMVAVMVGVISTSIVAGLAATLSLALAVVLAGVVGLVGVIGRRTAQLTAPEPVAEAQPSGAAVLASTAESPYAVPSGAATASDAVGGVMAPRSAEPEDPEANMPRWRRPSLLAARRGDATRFDHVERSPVKFRADAAPTTAELRVVRYAVVPLLDRPDEVVGRHILDLVAGDEVQAVETSGVYWQIVCPDGATGWVHRTTLSLPSTIGRDLPDEHVTGEADDALTALLTARGLN
jgi:hypothetical protein